MPLTAFRPLVTDRFHEVDILLRKISAEESSNPLVSPDSAEVRILRGLFYVHLYGAFEFSIDQSFIRLAQHIGSKNVLLRHLDKTVHSVALETYFESFRTLGDWSKRFRKRVDMIQYANSSQASRTPDTVLSAGMQSVGEKTIKIAFDLYGISASHLYDPAAGGYISEVVERRHAVAHGREGALTATTLRSQELRLRYNALYNQAVYVIDEINKYMNSKLYVSPYHRRKY